MSAITFICLHIFMQWIPLYCTSNMSRSPNFFPLTKKEQERYLQLPYNSTVYAPKNNKPNTQCTVLLLCKQEQLFPRYKKTAYLLSVAMKEESVPLRLPQASLTHFGMLPEVHSCSWNAIVHARNTRNRLRNSELKEQ